MCTRLITLIWCVLVLSLVGHVQATTTWTDADPADHLWSTEGNWDAGVPDSEDWAKIRNGPPGPTLISEGAVADRVHVGYDPNSALTVDGGTLAIVGVQPDLLLGKNGGDGTLNMISGTINIKRDLEVAGGDPGVINMIGGTIIVGDDFEIPESEDDVDSIARVNLDGGTIILDGSYEGDSRFRMYARGMINIKGGTLIIPGDEVSRVQGYIDNGWITAYDGNGTLELDYDITHIGRTTLRAVHELKPSPRNSGFASAGSTELSWTLPDPCVPGETVFVDVYFTDDYDALSYFTDPESIQIVNHQNTTSVIVQTQPKTEYYWAVDTYIGDPNDPILGPIFSFFADNARPDVYAGADVVSWLEDGVRTRAVSGSVTDDGAIEPYTVQWTVVSEPNDPNNPDAVIADATAENASITMSAVGDYVLQLDAFDGEYTNSDTITIHVYADSCEAAKTLPGYEPLVGDLNGDCRVDDLDRALLEENWLMDISLTEEVELE